MFQTTCILCSLVITNFPTHPHCRRAPSFPHPVQDVLFEDVLKMVILRQIRGYLSFILICNPLLRSDGVHFPDVFCPLYIWFRERYIQVFSAFFNWVVGFVLLLGGISGWAIYFGRLAWPGYWDLDTVPAHCAWQVHKQWYFGEQPWQSLFLVSHEVSWNSILFFPCEPLLFFLCTWYGDLI